MRVIGLLRGVNVGKSVKVPMKDLKRLLEAMGFTNVVTYLNSGNVAFSTRYGIRRIRPQIEMGLQKMFGHQIPVLLLSDSTVRAIRDAIPQEWENNTSERTYVAYLFPPIDRPSLVAELPVRHHLIEFRHVRSALIWNVKRENYNGSRIARLASHKAHEMMTTRNVNTARRLAEL
jgi:uncharacterized protein (DUF1697 family)